MQNVSTFYALLLLLPFIALLPTTLSLSASTPATPKKASTLRRIYSSVTSSPRDRDELKTGIAAFYDKSTALWEEVWGEHLHHGYYVPSDRTDHKQAQVDMIDELLKFGFGDDASQPQVNDIIDVGCGLGGSTRHLAAKYSARATGITLSPYQAKRGNEIVLEKGMDPRRVSVKVADALDMPFENDSFDLVWSLESGEHMPSKEDFVNEMVRVAKPGGKIILCTWCHRDLKEGEVLTRREKRCLRHINRCYYLPEWCSVDDYVSLFEENGNVEMTTLKRDDWSYVIAPFWKAVIKSSLNVRSIKGLLKSGFKTIRGAWAMLLMLKGFDMGLIKFGLITVDVKDVKNASKK